VDALARSAVYGAFAAAFRSADGGADVLDEAVVTPPPADAAKAFMEAFEPSVSKRAVSLHASTHVNREQTDLYQELIRWYDHFGLKRRDGGELPDHLSVMLEFLQFLTFQEHTNSSDGKAVQTLHTAQADFIKRHLVPVVQEIDSKTEIETPRYRELPRALLAFLDDELAALG
jgi:DMSO reductase family type II enzyme chaperone